MHNTTRKHNTEWQASYHRGLGAERQPFSAIARRSPKQWWIDSSAHLWFNEAAAVAAANAAAAAARPIECPRSWCPVGLAAFGRGPCYRDRSQAFASSSGVAPVVSGPVAEIPAAWCGSFAVPFWVPMTEHDHVIKHDTARDKRHQIRNEWPTSRMYVVPHVAQLCSPSTS